jgi:hypothetical protein
VITNSIDDSIKLWDLRSPKHFVLVKYFSSNKAPATKFDLSQNESLLVMANHNFSKGERLESDTELIFYNTKDLSIHAKAPLFDTAVTDILWHPVLN